VKGVLAKQPVVNNNVGQDTSVMIARSIPSRWLVSSVRMVSSVKGWLLSVLLVGCLGWGAPVASADTQLSQSSTAGEYTPSPRIRDNLPLTRWVFFPGDPSGHRKDRQPVAHMTSSSLIRESQGRRGVYHRNSGPDKSTRDAAMRPRAPTGQSLQRNRRSASRPKKQVSTYRQSCARWKSRPSSNVVDFKAGRSRGERHYSPASNPSPLLKLVSSQASIPLRHAASGAYSSPIPLRGTAVCGSRIHRGHYPQEHRSQTVPRPNPRFSEESSWTHRNCLQLHPHILETFPGRLS